MWILSSGLSNSFIKWIICGMKTQTLSSLTPREKKRNRCGKRPKRDPTARALDGSVQNMHGIKPHEWVLWLRRYSWKKVPQIYIAIS
jgi:hypothetical protein